jgi:hypothetical protein
MKRGEIRWIGFPRANGPAAQVRVMLKPDPYLEWLGLGFGLLIPVVAFFGARGCFVHQRLSRGLVVTAAGFFVECLLNCAGLLGLFENRRVLEAGSTSLIYYQLAPVGVTLGHLISLILMVVGLSMALRDIQRQLKRQLLSGDDSGNGLRPASPTTDSLHVRKEGSRDIQQ